MFKNRCTSKNLKKWAKENSISNEMKIVSYLEYTGPGAVDDGGLVSHLGILGP